MYLRRFLFTLFALALAPPGFAQSLAKNFTLNGANQCATIGVSDLATVGITVTGTFSATLQPEVSIAGQSPGNTQVTPTTSNTAQATITTTGNYVAAVAGFDTFLLCVSSYASGTANVYLNPSGAVNASVIGGGGGGLAWNLNQNATGNLLLQNGTHTTTFQQTAAEPWLWANTTPATSSTPQDSPIWELEGAWWGASLASAVDGWSLEDVPGTSTTMAAGLVNHCSETSQVVTLAGTGMTVFPNILPGIIAATGGYVTFQGFTTCTWLNGVPVSLKTNTATSITFEDPTNHANQASVAEANVTASSAQSALTLQQVANSAPLGVFQLVNPAAATATSTNASPAFQLSTNSWGAPGQINTTWSMYSQQLGPCGASCVGAGTNPSLIFSLQGNNPAQSGDSILFVAQGNSPQDAPQLGFYNSNAGQLNLVGQIGVEPSDGFFYNQVWSFYVQETQTATSILGNEGGINGADVLIGAETTRTSTTGPNYGVVIGGFSSGGTLHGSGSTIFSPASGASANYGIGLGTEFNPTSGTSTFSGTIVNPIIKGTSSGNTSALTVAPQFTGTNLTGTNLVADFQSAPGTSQVNVDYNGDVTTAVLKSAAGTPLPTCNAAHNGSTNIVSDATSPTYLGTYTSGGAVESPVFCNGTNWVTY